jgi:hypothetical protein
MGVTHTKAIVEIREEEEEDVNQKGVNGEEQYVSCMGSMSTVND